MIKMKENTNSNPEENIIEKMNIIYNKGIFEKQ